jgi:hypothetical protein
MPMTVLIALRFRLGDTVASCRRIDWRPRRRDFGRGAFAPIRSAGAARATAITCVCYAFLRANYGLFSFGVTAYVA